MHLCLFSPLVDGNDLPQQGFLEQTKEAGPLVFAGESAHVFFRKLKK